VTCLQDERTPLHIACRRGHVEVVSALLSAGADVFSKDKVMMNFELRVMRV
jgi:ankyrin repeat protein